MSTWFRRALRSAVAITGAGAVLVVMATPASAELPSGVTLSGEVTGDVIRLGDRNFDLGTGNPDPCNPNDDPSTIEADVGPISGGVATISNMELVFTPAEVANIFGQSVCATVVVTNTPGGTQTGLVTDNSGTVTIDSPDVVANVEIDSELFGFPGSCRIAGIDLGQGEGGSIASLSGTITDVGTTWDLELEVGSPDGPLGSNDGFFVPTSSGCSFAAGTINSELNLPTEDTGARFQVNLSS